MVLDLFLTKMDVYRTQVHRDYGVNPLPCLCLVLVLVVYSSLVLHKTAGQEIQREPCHLSYASIT